MTKAVRSYIKVLRKAGLRKCKQHQPDIIPYALGTEAGNQRYAEIQIYNGWSEVWLVGKDIKDTGTISYPGGTRFQDAEALDKYLQSLPKFQLCNG